MDPTNNPSSGSENKPELADKPDVKDKEGSKTFTQDELGKKLSEERKKLRADFEKEKADAIAAEKAEWERQSKLTEEQRAKEAQEAERKELAERERKVALAERRIDAVKKLTEKNVPSELVDFVVDVDAGKTDENIAVLGKVFGEAVEKAVNAKLSGSTPTDPSASAKSNKPATGTTSKGLFKANGRMGF